MSEQALTAPGPDLHLHLSDSGAQVLYSRPVPLRPKAHQAPMGAAGWGGVTESEWGSRGGLGKARPYQAGLPGREVPHPGGEEPEPEPERLRGKDVRGGGELN